MSCAYCRERTNEDEKSLHSQRTWRHVGITEISPLNASFDMNEADALKDFLVYLTQKRDIELVVSQTSNISIGAVLR